MSELAGTSRFSAAVADNADDLGPEVASFSIAHGLPERLSIRFESTDESFASWVGAFQRGYPGSLALEAVIPLGWNAIHCLVVAAGQGYVVNTETRQAITLDHPFPITFAERIDHHPFVVAADLTSVAALGANGVVWINRDLGDGELLVDGIDAANVVGRGWDAPTGEFRRFTIDLASGAFERDA